LISLRETKFQRRNVFIFFLLLPPFLCFVFLISCNCISVFGKTHRLAFSNNKKNTPKQKNPTLISKFTQLKYLSNDELIKKKKNGHLWCRCDLKLGAIFSRNLNMLASAVHSRPLHLGHVNSTKCKKRKRGVGRRKPLKTQLFHMSQRGGTSLKTKKPRPRTSGRLTSSTEIRHFHLQLVWLRLAVA
jgi:hypothetical protein